MARDRYRELSVLTIAAILLVAAGYSTIRAGNDSVGRDLTYEGTTAAANTLLRSRGADAIAVVRSTAVFDTAGMTDTLAITGDSTRIPSLHRGGFLRDAIEQFNDHAVRRAVLTNTRAYRASLGTPSSLFNLSRSDDATRRLSDQVNPYVLRVSYPLDERSWLHITTDDHRRGPALVGATGSVDVSNDDSVTVRSMLNGRSCAVTRQVESLIYCESESGLAVGKNFDLSVRVGNLGSSRATLRHARGRRGHVNAKPIRLMNAVVAAGDIIETPELGAFTFSVRDHGTVAGGQWVNGRNVFVNSGEGTLAFFGRAGRFSREWPLGTRGLRLSFNASLSSELDARLERFGAAQHSGHRLARAAVVISDLRTGEVRALAEYGRDAVNGPMISFEPILLGSIVKPILAAAIVARAPELARLRVAYDGGVTRKVAGIELREPFHNPANALGCRDEIDLKNFIRCSSNQFAAELVIRSLQLATEGEPFAPNGTIPTSIIERSPLMEGLALAFDVNADSRGDSLRANYFWQVTEGAEPLVDDASLFPRRDRPWLLAPASLEGTSPDLVARYAFGGWENRWTILGIAQAFSRIATDREVTLSFVRREAAGTLTSFRPMSPAIASAFAQIRDGMETVGLDGTASGLTSALRSRLGPQNRVRVLAKTGTLNEADSRHHRGGVFMKSLAVAIGQPRGTSGALGCGLMVVTYFEFDRVPVGSASLPNVHLEFALRELAPALASFRAPTC